MSKPMGPNMATATPLDLPGAQTAQKQYAGLLELDAQPSAASTRLPEGGAPKVSAAAQVRRAHIRTPTRHRAPDQEPGRILIPGDGAAGDQEAQNTFACAEIAGYATPVACPVSTTSWRYGLRRTHRLVADRARGPRSAWFNQARLALLAVTHCYKRTPCLWLETISDRCSDSARLTRRDFTPVVACAIPGYVFPGLGRSRGSSVCPCGTSA